MNIIIVIHIIMMAVTYTIEKKNRDCDKNNTSSYSRPPDSLIMMEEYTGLLKEQ